MLRFSSPESAEKGLISALAIVECIASILIYILLSVHFGTLVHYAAAICVAPLFLFRTPGSIETGLIIHDSLLRRYNSIFDSDLFADIDTKPWPSSYRPFGAFRESARLVIIPVLEAFAAVFYFLLLPLIGLSSRFSVALWHVLRHPIDSLLAMPQNWMRQSICTDLLCPPEMVPNEDEIEVETAPSFELLTRRLRDKRNGLLMRMAVLAVLCIAYIPPTLLRISFKATSVVYAPFVWIAQITLRSSLPIKIRLERITRGELERVRRALSSVVILCVFLKICFITGLLTFAEFQTHLPIGLAQSAQYLMRGWPAWQVALLGDAIGSYLLFFAADAFLARLETWDSVRTRILSVAVSLALFLRAASATFAIAVMSLSSARFLASTLRQIAFN